jgi:hypothetical protein
MNSAYTIKLLMAFHKIWLFQCELQVYGICNEDFERFAAGNEG